MILTQTKNSKLDFRRLLIARKLAIKMVVSMMCVKNIKPMDACKIAAKRHGINPHWLFRQVTE